MRLLFLRVFCNVSVASGVTFPVLCGHGGYFVCELGQTITTFVGRQLRATLSPYLLGCMGTLLLWLCSWYLDGFMTHGLSLVDNQLGPLSGQLIERFGHLKIDLFRPP